MVKPVSKIIQAVLPSQEIENLVLDRAITFEVPLAPKQIQPSSIDLRLGSKAWRMQASFLPGKAKKVETWIDQLAMQEINLNDGYILEKGSVYLVQLQESLDLPEYVEAQANAKSSTGRLDLFTRLIVDYGSEFDTVSHGYSGPLYTEIAPNSFSVFARTGIALNQIRFKTNNSFSMERLKKIKNSEETNNNIECLMPLTKSFSINLKSQHGEVVGYRAKPHTDLIDLEKVNHYRAEDFWDKVTTRDDRIVLDPGAFYILSSREYVSVPPQFAAEMAPYLSMIGEFRVHYAGFFDPGFGYSTDGSLESRAVLEVRCHETPFLLEHGQTVGQLIFENMLDKPKVLYGKELKSNYQGQSLKLSKHFKN